MAHDVFISYTTTDKAVADAVCHRLEAAGIRCWIAPRDVGYGKDWGASIVEAIGAAKLVVVIFSAAANASRHILDEVGTALDTGATVIPFRIEDILPTGALRLHLNRLHWLDALSSPLDQHIDRLIESAKRNLPAAVEDEGAPPRQEEQPRQPMEEPSRLLRVTEEPHRSQKEPARKQGERTSQPARNVPPLASRGRRGCCGRHPGVSAGADAWRSVQDGAQPARSASFHECPAANAASPGAAIAPRSSA